jgi:hypothetical protein
MKIHAHLSHARSIFAPPAARRPLCLRGDGTDGTMDAGIICLLPARDEEDGSRGYLESARSVCDAIVALDHGSTDATADILQASPIRDADELEPRWLLWLDADERIDGRRSGSMSGRLSAARPGSTRVSRSTCTVRCTLDYAPNDSANRRMA